MAVPICLEHFLAMNVLFLCRRLIQQINILAMISVNRCCALIFTLRYYAIVTKWFLGHVVCTCVSFWVFSFILIYVMFHDNESLSGFYYWILYLTPKVPINIISRLVTLTIVLFNIFLYIYLSFTVSIRSYKNNGRITKNVKRVIQNYRVFLDLLQSIHINAGSPRYPVWIHLLWKNPCSDIEFNFPKQCYQSCLICLEVYQDAIPVETFFLKQGKNGGNFKEPFSVRT